MNTEELENLFEETFDSKPDKIKKITGGGSLREYFRLQKGELSVIGVIGEDIQENETFINLDESLKNSGINVPLIISVAKNKKTYLLQDLGDESLFKLLNGPHKMELSKMALKNLVRLQTIPEKIWKDKVGYKPFSERLIKWDLNYFKYDFLKAAGILFDEEKLEDDFERLTRLLCDPSIITGLMYRDFQSRNILIKDNELWFIDFQGARKGPITYDAVSFIWQAKAPFTFEEREELSLYYISELSKFNIRPENVIPQLSLMQIFRNLQVLGAYGFRGLIERKLHFIESIPYAVNNFYFLKEKGRLKEFSELEKIADKLKKKYLETSNIKDKDLTLTIYSFSFKKGYPEDLSGNGGGFMFDCRAIHNPGRYEAYKNLTGKDKEVKDFLDSMEEAGEFVDNAIKLVNPSVNKYLQRGFTSLQVGFGCTGGQHRSVYCAELFSNQIKKLYPQVKIKLIHREQPQL